MTRLMPTFYAQLEIQPGSIHDQIVQAKLHSGAISRMIGGLLLAVAAVALTVVSLGTAIPAIVAAGASLGAAALSTAMAYNEYQHYRTDHALANAGFADDPSELWLALAIVGAGVDLAAAAKAVRVLAPAARALDHGGPLADFTSTLDALRRSQQLDQRLAAAAEHAAAARTAYTAARSQLTTALGKAYAFPGPFTDPAVYRALVQMATAKIREGSHSLTAFLAELRQARLAAKLGELTPEELTQAKQAWAQGELRETIGALPEEQAERLLYRITRGDAKGRSFGTPRNPNPPSVEEFNPRIQEIRAGEVERQIMQTKHGLLPEQEANVRLLSNEELIRFRVEDPISATQDASGGLSLTGGHHRTTEISRRVAAGQLPADTRVPFLLHD